MTKEQFRVLYHEFLFRMVDLEVLSAGALGDMSKLFGQFAALLIFLSIPFSLPALGYGDRRMGPQGLMIYGWSMEHFLISSTMLVVGIFAVLSWDSTFPNRRDVLVLTPLPVRARTMFLAKVAAVGSALGLTVVLLHALAGLVWPATLTFRIPATIVPTLTHVPAMPPVAAADLPQVLDRDLEQALRSGLLAPHTHAGLVIGVYQRGVRRIIAYGTAQPDSIFEIGSVSKTFTGLLLAKMAAQGRTRLDEPVRELLPPGVVPKPTGGEITLVDLATHRSGLPGMPFNLNMGDKPNPGAHYNADDLYRFLARYGLDRPPGAGFQYSNLGFGLLGTALANRAGVSFDELLKREVTDPLGMTDTAVWLSPAQQPRMIQAYDPRYRPVSAWGLDALAPAGAIRSTAADMLTYLEANLHPERFPGPLGAALKLAHQPQADLAPGFRIGLAWANDSQFGSWSHGGAISGYSTFAFFNPQQDAAGIVLLNQATTALMLSQILDQHIEQRLAGKPAISLDSVVVPARGGMLTFPRWFAAYWITMLAAGAFIFCCVLGLQGLAAQLLPRPLFLRVSSFLQTGTLCLFVCVYFLQPLLADTGALATAQHTGLLSWSPSYWFLGFFQQMSGSPALAVLARRAWTGLAVSASVTAVTYTFSYWRTLRKIVEEPDIVPGAHRGMWLPPFGNPMETAVVQFAARTLARSRQHRMILAFYLGLAFAITIFFLRSPGIQREMGDFAAADQGRLPGAPLLAASVVIAACWVVGMRMVFALPLDLRANWIFRVTPVRGGLACLKARRRALTALAAGPFWLAAAVFFFATWTWRAAAIHLTVLALLAAILAEVCLYGIQKIPFTCSYLPGKTNFHMTFWWCVAGLIALIERGTELELRAIGSGAACAAVLVVMVGLAAAARWRTFAHARSEELQFEDAPDPAVQTLGL
jgi:CubicO group peptidase (beta-lactamase class C family)